MEPEKKKAPKETEIDIEALKDVCGGSALDNVPVVDEHDYDEDIRKKIGGN